MKVPEDKPDWFNPLAGWEAATRWNRATFDWVAKGWQQWVALMTTMPTRLVPPTTPTRRDASTSAQDPVLRAARRAGEHTTRDLFAPAMAQEGKRKPRPAAARKSSTKARTRG